MSVKLPYNFKDVTKHFCEFKTAFSTKKGPVDRFIHLPNFSLNTGSNAVELMSPKMDSIIAFISQNRFLNFSVELYRKNSQYIDKLTFFVSHFDQTLALVVSFLNGAPLNNIAAVLGTFNSVSPDFDETGLPIISALFSKLCAELTKLLTLSYFVNDDEVILKGCSFFLKAVREREREINEHLKNAESFGSAMSKQVETRVELAANFANLISALCAKNYDSEMLLSLIDQNLNAISRITESGLVNYSGYNLLLIDQKMPSDRFEFPDPRPLLSTESTYQYLRQSLVEIKDLLTSKLAFESVFETLLIYECLHYQNLPILARCFLTRLFTTRQGFDIAEQVKTSLNLNSANAPSAESGFLSYDLKTILKEVLTNLCRTTSSMHHKTANRRVLQNLSILADFALNEHPQQGPWTAAVFFWAVNGFQWRSLRLRLYSARELCAAYWLLANTLSLQRHALAQLIARREASRSRERSPAAKTSSAENDVFWPRLMLKVAEAEHRAAESVLSLILCVGMGERRFLCFAAESSAQELPGAERAFFGRFSVLAMDLSEVYEKYRKFEAERSAAPGRARKEARAAAIRKGEAALAAIEEISKLDFKNGYAERLVSERTRAMAGVLMANQKFLTDSERPPIGGRLSVDRKTGLLEASHL